MPQTEPSVLSRPLAWLARGVVRYPLATVVIGVLAAVASVLAGQRYLSFHTSRADVLNPASDYNRRWLEYAKEFGDDEDVIVAVERTGPQEIVPVLDEIAAAVAREPRLFSMVWHKVDLAKVRAKGLYFLEQEDLAAIEGFLARMDPLLQGDWSQLGLSQMAGAMATAGVPPGGPPGADGAHAAHRAPEARQFFEKYLKGLAGALAGQAPGESPWPEMSPSAAALRGLTSNYLLTNDGRFGFVFLRFAQKDEQNFAQNTEAVEALRRILDRVKANYLGKMNIGLTGLPVMENDEMRQSEASMSIVTVLSLAGVLLVLLAGFGGFRHSLMATAALLLGTIWTLGYTTLAVGYLNILSIAFGSILMGLGINYGIYYCARYLQLSESSASTDEALVKTAASVGPSITAGALTAACSFFTTALADFPGIAQLGIIAGGGILLCWLAAMTVLPAIIKLADAGRGGFRLPAPLDIYSGLKPLYRYPRLALAATAVITVALSLGIARLAYDDNLLNLQPVGQESVEWERRLLTETNQSSWYALSVAANTAEAANRAADIRRKMGEGKLPTIERVEEIARLTVVDAARKGPIIERIQRRLTRLPAKAPPIPLTSPGQLGQILARAGQSLSAGPPSAQAGGPLAQLGQLIRQLPEQEYYRRLYGFQQRLADDLLQRLQLLQSVADARPPELGDLPESVVRRFVGRSGRYLLKIYSKADIWDTAACRRFVEEVRSIDPDATGNPIQVYEASRHMKRSYEQAALYAFIVIAALLWVEFGNLRYPLLAMLPLALGAVQMFGLMGLLNIPLNSANLIVLPLIIGLGVENGIHIVNDFRRRAQRYRRMSTATTTAVMINSLTTVVGFAALMIANHQGLQSLGRVLTIGMSCCLMSALVLPNLLLLRKRPAGEQHRGEDDYREDRDAGGPQDPIVPWRRGPQAVPIYRRADAA